MAEDHIVQNKYPLINKTFKILGVYLIAFLLPLGVEHLTELFQVRAYDYRESWYHAIFKAGYWYQRLLTAAPRKPRVHLVRLVVLSRRREPPEVLGQNLCGDRGQRAFMATLLRRLQSADPALIVVDKWYGPHSCPADDLGTQQLRDAIVEVSRNVPIVLGRKGKMQIDLERQSRDHLRTLEERGFTKNDLIAEPALQFESGDPSVKLTYGFLTLNYDVRKIPLSWPVYEDENDIGRQGYPQFTPTLAIAAVELYDREATRGLTHHPFTSFLSEEEFRPYSALDLICNPGVENSLDWRTCTPGESTGGNRSELRHHIVLIGEYAPESDFHETPIGDLPGMVLQGNYIESLLDDRFWNPVSSWLLVFFSLLWFLSIEGIFHWRRASPGTALANSLVLTLVFSLTLYVIAVMFLGYYLALWPTGILAVLLRYLLAALGRDF